MSSSSTPNRIGASEEEYEGQGAGSARREVCVTRNGV